MGTTFSTEYVVDGIKAYPINDCLNFASNEMDHDFEYESRRWDYIPHFKIELLDNKNWNIYYVDRYGDWHLQNGRDENSEPVGLTQENVVKFLGKKGSLVIK
jgi:hypothetical protein